MNAEQTAAEKVTALPPIAKKILKIAGLVLAALLALILLVWGSLHIAKYYMYPDYYGEMEKIAPIPGLNGGFVPQGLAYDAERDIYLHSGYSVQSDENGEYEQAELYVVEQGKVKKLTLIDKDGAVARGHAGGVSVAGNYLYISDNANERDGRKGFLRVYNYKKALEAKNGDEIFEITQFPVDTASSFCFSDGKYIYVGEFFRPVDYEISPLHAFTTPAGDENRALVAVYPLNKDGSLPDGLEEPDHFISITSQVQGFAITEDGKIALSRSWGLSPSYLEIHSGLVEYKPEKKEDAFKHNGEEYPLYYLDSSTREKNVAMPAFSEGVDIVDGNFAVSFESACNKYIVGKLFFAYNVISYPAN